MDDEKRTLARSQVTMCQKDSNLTVLRQSSQRSGYIIGRIENLEKERKVETGLIEQEDYGRVYT
jgi:hypothetical protein